MDESSTERQTAQALHPSADEYRLLFSGNPQPMMVYDEETRAILAVNEAAVQRYGYSEQEFLKKRVLEILPPQETERVARYLQTAPRGARRSESLHQAKDGSLIHVEISSRPVSFAGRPARLIVIMDVTDRKRAESAISGLNRELQQRLAELRTLLNVIPVGIALAEDQECRTVQINQALARLLGIRPASELVTGEAPALGLCVPGQALPSEVAGVLGQALRDVELSARLEQGRTVHLLASTAPLPDAQGEARGRIASFLDITQRKSAEAELLRTESELRGLFEALPDLYFQLDWNGRILSYHAGREQELYVDPQEFLGRRMQDVLPPEAAAILENAIKALKDRGDNVTVQYSLPAHGGERTYEGRLLSISDSRMMLVVRNITALKRFEEATRQSHEMLRAIIEASPLAILAMDFEGHVQTWNPAAERIFGWTPEEVLGKLFPGVPDDDLEFFRHNMERAMRGESIGGVERKRRRKDGTLVDVGLWTAVRRNAAGEPVGVTSVIADITDRRKLEEQLLESRKLEAIGRLAGGVAHEFNNLLTIVTGYTQLLLDRLSPMDPWRSELDEILKAGNRAAALTNELLAFGRKQMMQPQVVDLNRIVSGMEPSLRRMLRADMHMECRLGPNLGEVRVDPGQIEQILVNLVVNARDAMPQGGTVYMETAGMELHSRSHTLALKPGRWVLLKVSDTGIGMDSETQRRLFEPFFTTRELGKGTGLGLSTVYGIVKQHGGDIFVTSQKGLGTTFTIFLPCAEPAVAG